MSFIYFIMPVCSKCGAEIPDGQMNTTKQKDIAEIVKYLKSIGSLCSTCEEEGAVEIPVKEVIMRLNQRRDDGNN